MSETGSTSLIFMDRDGALCRDLQNGVLRYEDFRLVPEVDSALGLLSPDSFRIAVVTNQPYLGENKLSLATLERMHTDLKQVAERAGIAARNFRIYTCPHREADDCGCRKPRTGNLEDAYREMCPDGVAGRFYVVGDQATDLEAGLNFGNAHKVRVATVLLDWELGYRSQDQKVACLEKKIAPNYVAQSLLDAARWIRVREE